MSEKSSEKPTMDSAVFVQYALREHVAPPAIGSVKARRGHAARRLGWSHTRIKDAWYADPRISISADEIRQVQELTGIEYGRQQLRRNRELIDAAAAILGDTPESVLSIILAALVKLGRS